MLSAIEKEEKVKYEPLNPQELEVSWSLTPSKKQKREEAESKNLFRKAQDELRTVVDLDGNLIEHFSQVVNKGCFIIKEVEITDEFKSSIRILNEKGDETLYWRADDPDQVRETEKKFQEYLDKGWRAYAVDKKGNKGRKIKRFDANKEEIIFTEGPAQKLKDFAKAFKKTEMIPQTKPG